MACPSASTSWAKSGSLSNIPTDRRQSFFRLGCAAFCSASCFSSAATRAARLSNVISGIARPHEIQLRHRSSVSATEWDRIRFQPVGQSETVSSGVRASLSGIRKSLPDRVSVTERRRSSKRGISRPNPRGLAEDADFDADEIPDQTRNPVSRLARSVLSNAQLEWWARRIDRRGMEGWGCPEPHPPALMAAASALTRFTPSSRSGPHPSKPRREVSSVSSGAPTWAPLVFTRDGTEIAPVLAIPLLLGLAAGEDAGHEVQNVGRTRFIIAVIPDQATLHHVDFFLGRLVDNIGHDRTELDGVLLVLE